MITRDGDAIAVEKRVPPGLRELRLHRWLRTPEGLLVCPSLAEHARRLDIRLSR